MRILPMNSDHYNNNKQFYDELACRDPEYLLEARVEGWLEEYAYLFWEEVSE